MSTGNQEIGGASIKGRPSIHSHPFCPFAHAEAMGRVGMLKKRKVETAQRENRSNGPDADVVDHGFSKPMLPITEVLSDKPRRNSLDGEYVNEQTEEDNSNLSKSLPATFVIPSYYSDEISEDEVTVSQEYQDNSYQSSSSSLYNPSANRTPENRSQRNASDFFTNTYKAEEKKSNSKLLWLLGLFGVAATVASMFRQTNTTLKAVYAESEFYKDIDQLGIKYKIDDNAILQMQTGIATISERQDTGSFMFVYNSNDDNFNEREFNMFISKISNTASKYLRNESTPSIPIHYTLVEAAALDLYGHSELINTFREDLDRTGVMLVKHLEAIPSSLAMAFHYYCDEYNPLVKKSAIFFTLNLAKCPKEMDKKSTHATIEKCLAHKWTGIPTDSIGPLLTRVVSVVIDLTDAF